MRAEVGRTIRNSFQLNAMFVLLARLVFKVYAAHSAPHQWFTPVKV